MDGLLALTIILLIYSIGDIIANKTKSIVSMLFTASVLFILAFWGGLPTSIFEDSQLLNLSSVLVGLLITHMGTLLSIEDFVKQWKTVVVAAFAIAGIGIFLNLMGSFFVERIYAIAAAPPIAGGVVAAIIMGEAAAEVGNETVRIFVTLIVALQGFVGYPLCSVILNREAKSILSRGQTTVNEEEIEVKKSKRIFPELPKDLQTDYILLFKLALVAFISYKLAGGINLLIAQLTGYEGSIFHPLVVCLIMGIVARETGFLEVSVMTRANSFGLGMAALLAPIFGPLASATPEVLKDLILPLIICLILGVIGILIFSTIASKLLKMSTPMAIAIGVTALFGFPGTYVLSNEVATANGKTKEERQLILDEILPRMLVAGFATVTIGSVIMAGIMAPMI